MKKIKNAQVLVALGLNLAALRHDFNLTVEVDCSRFIMEDLEKNDLASAKKNAASLLKLLTAKHAANKNLLNAIEYNRSSLPEKINIHTLIAAVLQIARLDERVFIGIAMETQWAEQDLYVTAVPHELYFVIQNLVANAINAMLLSGTNNRHTLIVKTRKEKSKISIHIQDTGPGMRTRGRRSGFGLWYVRMIMKKYGRLQLHSSKTGTTATITLQGAET